jgi:hypothetical protein
MFFKLVASFRAEKTAEAAQTIHHRSEDTGHA